MVQKERALVITGNWKMYKTFDEAEAFINGLLPNVKDYKTKICLALPYTLIMPITHNFNDIPILFGAQNMNDASEGAFTGEIAARMLKDAGAQFVLLGHSERRHLYNEDDAFINRKVKRAVKDGISPILCIGETKEEHEANRAQEVITRQIKEGLAGIEVEQLHSLGIAYEPVWAVGTGKSATPQMAQDIHHFCRNLLAEMFTPEFAEKVIIQYGGSVTPSNAEELLIQKDVDGLLLGGASLSLDSFTQIINHAESILNRKVESI